VKEADVSAYPFPTINCLAFVAYSGARIVLDRYYVTGQPSSPAYAAIAAAGIRSVVCVRQPGEPAVPPPVPPVTPFDTTEEAQLAKLGVSYHNIPITRTMTQQQFDTAATQAAIALLNNGGRGPALIHCSTGDRAASVFAVVLILAARFSNADAADFAINSLLLANPNMIELVLGYKPPPGMAEQIRTAAAGFVAPGPANV
jgi:protein tyrosine phosphatase (PTP) superfamily phosphohydrolase (DUF442 family)